MSDLPHRDDAVQHRGRWIVPTTEATQWVDTWSGFVAAKGVMCWNEDQTEIELRLPAPFKFSIQFGRSGDDCRGMNL